MARANNLVATHQRRRGIIARAKGYFNGRRTLLRTARDAVWRAGASSFAHRRHRPNDFRRLWIIRINAACRQNGLSYSKFIHGLILQDIQIDRKILAELAVNDPGAFKALAEKVSAAQ